MNIARGSAALALVGVLGLVGAACGNAEDAGTQDPAEASPTAEADATAASPTTAAAATGTIAVQADDYEFIGIPEELPAGETTFTLDNVGEEFHELVLFKLNTDKSVQEILELPEKQAEKLVQPVGGTFAKPGEQAKKPVTGELEPGRYAALCFVSVGTTPENKKAQGPPHFTKGMVAEFTVE